MFETKIFGHNIIWGELPQNPPLGHGPEV